MTKEKSLEPPRLAAWLLVQFSPVAGNVPLAGDLMEEFRKGRSAGWYWRQVLWAIPLAFLQSLRREWGRLAYAVLCGGLISTIWPLLFRATTTVYVRSAVFVDGGMRLNWDHTVQASTVPAVYALYAKSYGIQWPWSLLSQIAFIAALQVVIVAFAIVVYGAFARGLKARNFIRALAVVTVVLASSSVAATFLSVALSAGWGLIGTPTMIAMLVGLWMADPGGKARPVPA
jgi:hypothetical protein